MVYWSRTQDYNMISAAIPVRLHCSASFSDLCPAWQHEGKPYLLQTGKEHIVMLTFDILHWALSLSLATKIYILQENNENNLWLWYFWVFLCLLNLLLSALCWVKASALCFLKDRGYLTVGHCFIWLVVHTYGDNASFSSLVITFVSDAC